MNKRYEEGRKPFFSESGETQRKQYVWAKDKEGKEYLQETESIDIQAEIESYADECDIKNIVQKTLGGERLRSESKMEVYLPNFGRSSHNVGKIIRTSQACGTIVPYWCQIGLDGTTFYIDITTKVKTLTTTSVKSMP